MDDSLKKEISAFLEKEVGEYGEYSEGFWDGIAETIIETVRERIEKCLSE